MTCLSYQYCKQERSPLNMEAQFLFVLCLNLLTIGSVHNAGCGGIQADIVFLLDASGSVGQSNFGKELDFVKGIVQHLDIGPSNTQIGLVDFSSKPHLEFHLNRYKDEVSTIQGISSTQYHSGGTNTAEAIKFVRENAFLTANGARLSASKMLILITDGRSANPPQTIDEANKIKNEGITVFAIGVGSGVSKNELDQIASNPQNQHVFTVDNFDALTQIKQELQMKACQVHFTGQCIDSQFISCNDSHVCNDQALMKYCPVTCKLCEISTTTTQKPIVCVDSTFIQCGDSHVCSDDLLKTYCPVTCGLCVQSTTPPPCLDSTFIQCSDSHVCSDDHLKTYCPLTCGLCGQQFIIG